MSALHLINATRFKGFDFTARLSRCFVKKEHVELSEQFLSPRYNTGIKYSRLGNPIALMMLCGMRARVTDFRTAPL